MKDSGQRISLTEDVCAVSRFPKPAKGDPSDEGKSLTYFRVFVVLRLEYRLSD
jgi:hypothetical protein